MRLSRELLGAARSGGLWGTSPSPAGKGEAGTALVLTRHSADQKTHGAGWVL